MEILFYFYFSHLKLIPCQYDYESVKYTSKYIIIMSILHVDSKSEISFTIYSLYMPHTHTHTH